MQLIKSNINIDFIGKRYLSLTISLIIVIISIVLIMFTKGLNYGIDFVGGSLVQLKFDSKINLDKIENNLSLINSKSIIIQRFGNVQENEILIKTNNFFSKNNFLTEINNALTAKNIPKFEIRRIERVGPQIGKELREKALLAIFYTLLLVTVYISGRFELKWTLSIITSLSLISVVYLLSILNIPIFLLIIFAILFTITIFWFMNLRYAMGATIALIHDIIVIIGIFSILEKEFTLSIVAALLTTVGYSLNDTIIVFDRIRENIHKKESRFLPKIINKSINETLNRTILTSLTTLVVVISLLFLGGRIIHDFAFALMLGIIIGTYSSIYVASPILIFFKKI